MLPVERLDAILARAEALQEEMNGELPPERFVELSKEYAEIDPLVAAIRDYRAALSEAEDLRALIAGDDAEMAELAGLELPALDEKLPDMEAALEILLLPKDSADELNVIVEVRAGTGGDEAALFAGDLFRMYTRYADILGWKSEIISQSEGEVGGYKEIVTAIRGKGVFARLKFESGVHRVQRVPETESGGRIHTSAATVAVLPEPEEVDVKIEEKICALTCFALPARAVNRSTPQTVRCVSPICRPALPCRNKMKNRSTKTAPRRCRFCVPGFLRPNANAPTASARRIAKAKSARAIDRSAFAPIISRKGASPITALI